MSSTKRKQIKVKAVAPKLKLFRSNEPLLSVFMWGVNHTVNELNNVNLRVMLMPDDFKSYSKIRVDNHMYNKDNMPSRFKVKEYCPIVFRNLRERFGLDDNDYMNSLSKQQPISCDSPGRSGARMLMSRDKRFFIKTLVSEEVEMMHHLLKQYHQYIVECHAQTLLPQYLAMYRITVNDVETYVVVMRNIFSPRLSIHKKYDLKGSTVDRKASDKERLKSLPTFKDNDFLNDGAKICIGPEQKKKLLETLQSDVDFLSSLHLMDYSLIVGIHDRDQEDEVGISFAMPSGADEEEPEDDDAEGGASSAGAGDQGMDNEDEQDGGPSPPDSPQPVTPMPQFTGELDPDLERYAVVSNEESGKREIYFMAVIDILTKYGMKKRTAQAAKTVKHGAGAEISTVHPEQYAKRFMDFITKCVE
ncbi:phosphatidylinositol 5-phosphate 4-kinase type-2 alpha [Biomphalaria pfeifferi]|uniref:1-phosphatidylinositol-5-phosphate 4-kinase n=1 Tax=Biomphalaria pfeifferi TaxID=112525 RepID=A0AAD8EZP1_BIOPF|nr:phosphatidylinositol 5-phosphate 4-kinase type-2 alpha [Biomphalaria pfeifferi]